MPSLPVNNESLDSQEDAYRRYFGALKKYTPPRPRRLLIWATFQIICYSLLCATPHLILSFIYNQHKNVYLSHRLYIINTFTQSLITFVWCIAVIHVLFKHKFANLTVMVITAILVSLVAWCASTGLHCMFYEEGKGVIDVSDTFFDTDSDEVGSVWRYAYLYTQVINFPFTLYLSVFAMYIAQFCCEQSCHCLVTSRRLSGWDGNLAARLIDIPNRAVMSTQVEVFEAESVGTGLTYADVDDLEDALDDEIELSMQGGVDGTTAQQQQRHINTFSSSDGNRHSVQSVSYQELESAARSMVTRWMLLYCLLFMAVLMSWFVIATVSHSWYRYGIVLFMALTLVYIVGKVCLKRSARAIDTAIIVPNFSFEIMTELLMATFYWCNYRMMSLRYCSELILPHVSLPAMGVIHIASEIFQDSVRMNRGYFNYTGNWLQRKKSSIVQWKVRGAIDTCIRFIVAIYSFIFVLIRFGTGAYVHTMETATEHETDTRLQMFGYSVYVGVFAVEMVYFGFLLFRAGCAGRISEQQQINLAEPLMRMYNADRTLFLCVFVGSMAMASFSIV